MRKVTLLSGMLLCFSISAGADTLPAPPAPVPPPATSRQADHPTWQLATTFQYDHFNVLGASFHEVGFSTSVSRAIKSWASLESQVSFGYGHTVGTTTGIANSLFAGAGPRIIVHNDSKVEPWFHAMGGIQKFRFTQTGPLGSNSGFAALGGGGVDYKFRPRMYFRFQGDYVMSRLKSVYYKNSYIVGGGVVMNF